MTKTKLRLAKKIFVKVTKVMMKLIHFRQLRQKWLKLKCTTLANNAKCMTEICCSDYSRTKTKKKHPTVKHWHTQVDNILV